MTETLVIHGGPIFDGERLHADSAAVFENGKLTRVVPASDASLGDIDLEGDILSPGFTDLQVNGGGGVLLNADPSVDTIQRIATAHLGLGTRHLLPTLITDTPEVTLAAITSSIEACTAGTPGVAGLHLEGPHLSVARKGAHDPNLIRPMEQHDLDALLDAASQLPILMVTLAPESVTPEQVTALAEAGVIVSLGHTDADFDTCITYAKAGARLVTHLFNAMSQLGSRAPGLVGAALQCATLSAGLIADGIHVHPATMRAAFKSKTGPGELFLVSDAMAVAGSDLASFTLNGREIHRRNGRLTLADGTLAGADLDLVNAVRVLVQDVGLPLETALASATGIPAKIIGHPTNPERVADFIRIKSDLSATSALQEA